MRSSNQDMVLWEQRIKARAESGLSVSEWCKLNEIKRDMMANWMIRSSEY